MAARWLLPAVMPVAAAVRYSIYSCDLSINATAAPFYSAPQIKVLEGGCATLDADPLGPCFFSPADAKTWLDALPAGHRAISLEGTSLYDVLDENGTSSWQDPLPSGAPGPWGDAWAATVEKRFDAWFANFSAIGGDVDMVMLDFEMGGHAYWYSMRLLADEIAADARWPALQAQLNEAGKPYGASFDDISDMASWTGAAVPMDDWRAYVWDIVVVDTNVAGLLNASVFEPIRKRFPNIKLSNFAHHHHTDPSGISGATAKWWPFSTTSAVAGCGTGSHVGTHQSLSFYGGDPWYNYSHILASQTADSMMEVTGSAFGAFAQDVQRARDVVAGAPDVPLHPWLAPRDFVCHDPGRLPAGSWLFGSEFWTEMIFHIALSTGATDYLWWKPGAQEPETVGRELALDTLHELERIVNDVACGGPAAATTAITGAETELASWTEPYVLSGATVDCGGGATKDVMRFTPRCLDKRDGDETTGWCTETPATYQNGTAAEFKIGSGFSMFPAGQNASLVVLDGGASAGFWLVR